MEHTRRLFEVYLHFVWTAYDRLPLITLDMEERLFAYIMRVCQDDGCEILAVGGVADRVHLLVAFGGKITISAFMKHIKGGSSRFVSQELLAGAWFAWQNGYGVFSLRTSDVPSVARYKRCQKERHAEGKLWARLESDSATHPES